MAGISKVILAITKAQITPNLHLETLNPNIDLGGFNTLMPDKLVEWKSASIRSGVSSFGSSGKRNLFLFLLFKGWSPSRRHFLRHDAFRVRKGSTIALPLILLAVTSSCWNFSSFGN